MELIVLFLPLVIALGTTVIILTAVDRIKLTTQKLQLLINKIRLR